MAARTGANAGAVGKIIELLDEVYPQGLTRTDIANELGYPTGLVSSLLARLIKPTPTRPQMVFITRWEYDIEGQKRYPRPVYKRGDSANKVKPKKDRAAVQRGVYHRKKMKLINSVFAYAQHIHSKPVKGISNEHAR